MEIIIFLIVAYFVYILFSGKKQKTKKRRPAFKKLYEQDQRQPIIEFEKKMIKGMFSENREVFVTAFVDDAYVVSQPS